MRRFPDEEIIDKARSRIGKSNEVDLNKELVDVAVDFKDEHEVTHSYVVSFKKGAEGSADTWIPVEISEVSSL